jgi:hypothetical protein
VKVHHGWRLALQVVVQRGLLDAAGLELRHHPRLHRHVAHPDFEIAPRKAVPLDFAGLRLALPAECPIDGGPVSGAGATLRTDRSGGRSWRRDWTQVLPRPGMTLLSA